MAFMLDNASNNDTFVDGIKSRCDKEGIPFNATWARLRCMPHTIHLAAIKVCAKIFFMCQILRGQQLLEAIGAVSLTESKKAMARSGNYQECVTAPLSEAANDFAVLQHEDDEDADIDDFGNFDRVLVSVDKVNKLKLFFSLVIS
jgi:hypothetical protein